MTSNQLKYVELMENRRHNLASEDYNYASMFEGKRHNLEQERMNWYTAHADVANKQLQTTAALQQAQAALSQAGTRSVEAMETQRSNMAREQENTRHNVMMEGENLRHNTATEQIQGEQAVASMVGAGATKTQASVAAARSAYQNALDSARTSESEAKGMLNRSQAVTEQQYVRPNLEARTNLTNEQAHYVGKDSRARRAEQISQTVSNYVNAASKAIGALGQFFE